jgi:YihY family inner membrane protein
LVPDRVVRYGRAWAPSVRFWVETESHVYAFSVAANIILSFFPFLIVMVSLCRYVLKWKAATDAIYYSLGDYFPDQIGEYITRNLKVVVASRGPFQAASVLVLLFTANGIFEPLEVALNRIWRCTSNRSYLKNQLVSLGLIFACGALALLSIVLTASDSQLIREAAGSDKALSAVLRVVFFNLAAVPVSILMLFLIYWLLPNCKIRAVDILPAAIGVGLLLELLKYVNMRTWPLLRPKLALEYGPFTYAATLILWGFVASMLILAGAEWSARRVARKAARQAELAATADSQQPMIPAV